MASVSHVKLKMACSNAQSFQKSTRKIEKTILDNFSNIISQNEKLRIKSSVNLLRHLAENKNEGNENEINYALGRLIRGLGSSTPSARAGFYTVLVALINLSDLTVENIFELLNKQLHKGGGNTKGENADISIGQILACGAILKSELWKRICHEEQKKILDLLLKASKERIYLNLVAYTFIVNKILEISEADFKKVLPLIKPEFAKPWTEHNIDTFYLLLSAQNNFPNLINNNFLNKEIGTREIICPESIEELCRILTTIPRLTAVKHPVYDMIGKVLAKSEHLPVFLMETDKILHRPNRNKHLIVINLFSIILQNLEDKSIVPMILTRNFIQQTLNYFKMTGGKNKDAEFQQYMQTFFESLLKALSPEEVNLKIKISVLKKLLFYPGTFIFEKVTRSKIIQHITLRLDKEGIKKLAMVYRGVVDGSEKIDSENAQNENWLNNDRLYAAHMLIKLLNHTAMKTENDWRTEQLGFLMNLGLFKVENGLPIGCELAASLKSAFFGALDLNLSKLEDLQAILSHLVTELHSKLTFDNLEAILRNPLTASEYETWHKTIKTISKIEKKKKGGLKSVFLTLFLQLALQQFNEPKLATEALNELFVCYDKTKRHRKNSDNPDEICNDPEEGGNDPLWIEVVVDLFLNLLSHNYHLLRRLIKCVFPHLCQYTTSTTIHQILSVIDPKNEDNPLSRKNEESDDDMDDEKDNALEEDGSQSEEEGLDEKDEVEDESINEKLRMALHKVLSSNGYQTDEESVDMDDMSDTEGENLNKALADAFIQFKPNLGRRKKQSKDQEQLMHFRVRVLDLIEIYLDSTPSMVISLEIMLPLLQAIEYSVRDEHQKPLNDRLKACLKKLSMLKKFTDTNDVNDKVLSGLLKSLLEKGTKNSMIIQDMSVQIADCCVFIIRCSNLLSGEGTVKKKRKHSVLAVIEDELHNYFYRRDCLTPYVLFKNILQLSWDGILNIVPLLFKYIFSGDIKPFKKNQAAELLKIFYTNQRYIGKNTDMIIEKLSEHHGSFSQNVIHLFRGLCENPNQKIIKERFVYNLFLLLSAMKSSSLNLDNMNWSQIAENIRQYRSYISFSKDAKMAFNRLCKHLGVSHIVKMQPKVVKSNNCPEDTEQSGSLGRDREKKRKKKGKNKEQLKLKKEAKELRLKSLSEGFGNLDFTSAANIGMEEENNGSDPEGSDVASKKGTKKRKMGEEQQEKISNGMPNDESTSEKREIKKKKRNSVENVKIVKKNVAH